MAEYAAPNQGQAAKSHNGVQSRTSLLKDFFVIMLAGGS